MNKTLRLTLYLGIITFISGSILLQINNQTLPSIQKQALNAKKNALKFVMPNAAGFAGTDEKLSFDEQTVFKALNIKDQLIGYIFSSAPTGYSGPIKLFIGVANKKITGVTILSQTETPGLGALAEDPKMMSGKDFSFLGQFKEKDINDKFIAKQDVVALTGATISSQAIADGIKEAIQQYENIRIK